MINSNRHAVFYGKHKYLSVAAQSLVDYTGIDDPVKAIEFLANELLKEAGIIEYPVNLELLASFQGVNSIEQVDMDDSGRLISLNQGGYKIQIKSTDTIGRRNFSCAHEIGHTLIPAQKNHPETKSDAFTGNFDDSNEEEYFCDVAARTLLLPETAFKTKCMDIYPSLENLISLSDIFQSSIESVALRMNQLQTWNCAVIIWEKMLKPSQSISETQIAFPGMEELSKPVEEWRIKYHVWRGDKVIFPANRHISADNLMVCDCIENRRYKGEAVIPCSSGEMICHIEAQIFPYRDSSGEMKSRIISLVFL